MVCKRKQNECGLRVGWERARGPGVGKGVCKK